MRQILKNAGRSILLASAIVLGLSGMSHAAGAGDHVGEGGSMAGQGGPVSKQDGRTYMFPLGAYYERREKHS